MDTVSFTTGFALGLSRSSGGAGGDIAFHEIIDNSVTLQTIPIDSTYHMTFNMMQVCPEYIPDEFLHFPYLKSRHFTGPGAGTMVRSSMLRGSDSDGTMVSAYQYNMCALAFVLVYENDDPIMAFCNYGVNRYAQFVTATDGDGKIVILPNNTYEFDVENATVPQLSLWKPGDTQFQNVLYDADNNYATYIRVTLPEIAAEWNVERDTAGISGSFAYLYRYIDGTVSFSANSYLGFSSYYGSELIFSDMTESQVKSKWNEVVTAINAVHGVDYRPATWGPIYHERPYD